jgi:hypothetical protein
MPTVFENRRNQYRAIYEALHKYSRIKVKDLSAILGVNRHTASRLLREAFRKGYILPPQIRKRSYANMKEYMYFVNCKDTLESYLRYIEDMNVIYHAVMSGFANFWIIAKTEIDVDGDVLLEGYRSDYHVAYAPNHSWEKTMQIMQMKVDSFNPEMYTANGTLRTRWNEHIQWDSEDEILSREFKYGMRKELTPIMRKNLISAQKIYEFLDRISDCCTVFARWFPETISAYDPYLFVFETDYEDFIIDLFSQLPTSSFFFMVEDRLFVYANMAKEFLRCTEAYVSINRLQIPLLLKTLSERGILKSKAHAILEYYYGKDL